MNTNYRVTSKTTWAEHTEHKAQIDKTQAILSVYVPASEVRAQAARKRKRGNYGFCTVDLRAFATVESQRQKGQP